MQSQYQSLVEGFPHYLQDNKPDTDRMIADIRQHGGVVLDEFVRLTEWRPLVEAVNAIEHGGPYHVVTRSHIPEGWPVLSSPHCTHITHDPWLPQHIEALQKAQAQHRHYHHGGDSVTKDFYVAYGTESHDRERVMRAMESLNMLDNSVYSRPPVTDRGTQTPIYREQPPVSEIQGRTMEAQGKSINHEQRYLHGQNWHTLRPYMLTCQTAVVLDNYCFNDDYSALHSEKMLYPIAAGIPWIYAGNTHQRKLMSDRGFRPHMPMAETPEKLIDQMLWLKAVFSNTEMTKNWQTRQGEIVIHNQEILAGLDKRFVAESTLCS